MNPFGNREVRRTVASTIRDSEGIPQNGESLMLHIEIEGCSHLTGAVQSHSGGIVDDSDSMRNSEEATFEGDDMYDITEAMLGGTTNKGKSLRGKSENTSYEDITLQEESETVQYEPGIIDSDEFNPEEFGLQ